MKHYLVKLVFAVEINGLHDQFDEQVRLVKAASGAEALAHAESLGKEFEEAFVSADGASVRWLFSGVTDCVDLDRLGDGGLAFGASVQCDDATAYRAGVEARWRHLRERTLKPETAEQLDHI